MPYSAPQALPPAPQHAQYQPPHRRNEDNELRTKVTNIEQQLGKINSILESLVISQQMQGRFPAQPQQNPKPANCIEETHEQVQAITSLRSGKKIDKTIAPKRVIQGGEKSKELGGESERQKLEEERKESKGQEHENDSEPVTKVPNDITVEDLKHAPFPQRLAKIPSYAKFLKELCTVKRNLHVKETAMMNESQSAILQCKIVPKYKDPGCPTISCIIGGCKIDRALLDLGPEGYHRGCSYSSRYIVYYPVDFIVLDTQLVDCESSKRHISVILSGPFLATTNAVIHCRRLNPNMKEAVRGEVLKLLDAGIIYPISDAKWVSPTQVVPKKSGVTVVKNEHNELVPTRVQTGWRMCIDYRKVNAATRKDHFPLPFWDQVLERVTGRAYYCFLDGYSGYNQIEVALEDQDKTTFTCPFGTYAYRENALRLMQCTSHFSKVHDFNF
ncbi:hypothetical protein Acr_00g0075050 [Actinidia rufa]|uniref:Reverse transcriptase domain-containing protein n=1 Tax=Actinidia rufa TaxID=165716 RepID=A0A7J0DUC5_9ERIC|nr:hypothetical protein Acr_00g0075050 [Actinidia rufa]